MSLPSTWVDKIFLKMALVYGRDFVGRWEGLEIADVKTDWGHELAGFENWPDAIAHALSMLPAGKPPTVLEFRDLARKAPRKPPLALPDAPAHPERVEAELGRLQAVKRDTRLRSGVVDHKAWAKRIVAMHDAGDKVRAISLRFAREALGLPVDQSRAYE